MAAAQPKQFTVGNLDRWGLLVKSWTTDLNYLSTGYADQPPHGLEAKNTKGEPLDWCLSKWKAVHVPEGGSVTVRAIVLDREDFEKRVGKAGVTITDMPPEECRHVVIVQGSPEVMVIRLPSKELMEEIEKELLSGVTYEVAPFYSRLFRGEAHPPTDHPDIMKLHANRIGDYTLRNCN